MMMSLGNKLTAYLLLGVLAVTALDVYLSLKRTRTNLLNDVRREVTSISRTLRVSLEKTGSDAPEQYFADLASEISGLENIFGVVFYDRMGRPTVSSTSLQGRQLPTVDVRTVITTQTPKEGLFREGTAEHYYRVEPIVSSAGEGIAAFLVLEDVSSLAREFHDRAVQTLLNILLLLVVLAVIASVVIRRSITQPLRTFARQIDHIGRGHFDQRLVSTRRDEIGLLAQEFDGMCARLEAAHQRLLTESEEKFQLERALRQSEKLAAIGQLASRLAHEIGTPLNIIRGRVQQLLQREVPMDKERAFLGMIIAQIERISRFIRQLLTLARRSEPRLRVVSLNEIVRRVAEVFGDRNPTSGVEIVIELAPKLPSVMGDPDQLQQVLLNLSANALEAVGTHGRIALSTRMSLKSNGSARDMVEIAVADTGPGILPGNLPHIFEPFFTTKEKIGGTGLGLTISREIVRSHHGEIRVESVPGEGTCFIVSLPQLEGSEDGAEKSILG